MFYFILFKQNAIMWLFLSHLHMSSLHHASLQTHGSCVLCAQQADNIYFDLQKVWSVSEVTILAEMNLHQCLNYFGRPLISPNF